MTKGWPKGQKHSPEHQAAIKNAWREPGARLVELAEPEEVQTGLVSAIRDGRIPPKYAPEIFRAPMPAEDDEE